MPDDATRSSEPLHVLVVDENDMEANRARVLLEEAGYQVTIADLPDIGLVRRVAPDALVLGLVYRGQASGLEFLERHAADPVTASIPVIVHASEDDLSDEQWHRLLTLAHPVVPVAQSSKRLLNALQRVLVGAADATPMKNHEESRR